MEIDVNYEPAEKEPIGTTLHVVNWVHVLGIILLLFVTAVTFLWYFNIPEGARQSNTAATPSIVAPATPERSSPAVKNEMSPRTPQPFVDYVRRTIDETPYYRREGRRRVNSQNTF